MDGRLPGAPVLPGESSRLTLFGGAALGHCARAEVARAVLFEIALARRRLHGLHRDVNRGCDTTVIVAGHTVVPRGLHPAMPRRMEPGWREGRTATCKRNGPSSGCRDSGPAFSVTGDCTCRELVLDALLQAHEFLVARGDAIRDPAAAARQHVRGRQHDYIRSRRREQGAQVRTDRLRDSARARALDTEEQRRLFEDIVDEAGSPAPLSGQHELERRLAARRARRTAGDPDALLAEVRSDLDVVAARCSTGRKVNVGTEDHPEHVTWWEAYIERPLGRRRRLSTVPLEATPTSVELRCPSSDDQLTLVLDRLTVGAVRAELESTDRLVIGALQAALLRDPGIDRQHVLAATLNHLAAAGIVPASRVEAFLGDLQRRATATRLLDALAPEASACDVRQGRSTTRSADAGGALGSAEKDSMTVVPAQRRGLSVRGTGIPGVLA